MHIKAKSSHSIHLAQPKIHLVTIFTDGHVAWEFCMRILTEIFYRNVEEATAITKQIQDYGEGICGGYIFEIAETKSILVQKQAKKEGFSLECLVEKD